MSADRTQAKDGLALYDALFGNRQSNRRALDHATLPTPLAYLSERGLLRPHARGSWTMIRCPAHKGGDEKKPSMIVSLEDGHFKCQACGAKGGDVVALHRLITGKDFLAAVADLGGRFHD